MDFLKTVTGKVVSGIVGLLMVSLGIMWWRTDPATKHMLLSGTGKITSWLFIVILLPWATFFISSWVEKFKSNLAGGILVFAYTLLETLLLLWLFNWTIPGAVAWSFFVVGALVALVYNLLICDWIADRMSA